MLATMVTTTAMCLCCCLSMGLLIYASSRDKRRAQVANAQAEQVLPRGLRARLMHLQRYPLADTTYVPRASASNDSAHAFVRGGICVWQHVRCV